MAETTESKNFIHAFIDEDIAPGGQYEVEMQHGTNEASLGNRTLIEFVVVTRFL